MPNNETWEKKFFKLFDEILSVRDPIYGLENTAWRNRLYELFSEQLTLARREERELLLNYIDSNIAVGDVVSTPSMDKLISFLSPTSITRNEEMQ